MAKKTAAINFLTDSLQKKMWEKAAELDERSLSEWIRRTCTKAAREALGMAKTGKS